MSSEKRKLTMQDLIMALEKPYPDFEIKPGKTALILIDMQKIASPEPFIQAAIEKGFPEDEVREAAKEYEEMFWRAVKNAKRILEACRKKGYDIFHVVLEAPKADPRYTAKVNRRIGLIIPPGAPEAEILDDVKPVGDELVIKKTNGGAFTGTNLDFLLRNMDIDSLILVGFLTDECVAATAYHAADLGYNIILVEDATATHEKETHDTIIRVLKDMCLKVKTTDEVVKLIEESG